MMHVAQRTGVKRAAVFACIPLLAIAALIWHGPIAQDSAYHCFSDQRTLLGIPHFWNVASNVPFAIVGILGLIILRSRRTPGLLPELKPSYLTFFIGAAAIAFGSGYYHLHPTNDTLVWDRLPMTFSFMAFVAIVIGEHFSAVIARRLLVPLILLGIASIGWWVKSGDLRLYALVQFLPMLLIPLVLLLYPSRFNKPWLVWMLLAFYAAAKVTEHFDAQIHRQLGGMSGHALKHVLAAIGMVFPAIGLRVRVAQGVS